ncbi:Nucleotide-binding universal stress protein, UspA family [Cohaesibacter sp. ES.047]|uniref:universal stress protein n=1 Tax=Cohaesibacter sp. ES.047 TaxID=1798205 RepID=UPI000BB7177E|nr:universal stress protein [Cohaesibacter sp. ES.047]SNY93360.1 Nucleotide-binding universal stress protein, UspA family [Cohaesibacter sp. ES.047]
MFKTIMVPVDLRHVAKLDKALTIAADMAKKDEADVIYVGITGPEPGALGHTPKEYGDKLDAFAASQTKAHGIKATTHMIVANDPSIDIDKKLLEAAKEISADLVVMATHVPNFSDAIWPSHGGHLASHTDASIFLVRG